MAFMAAALPYMSAAASVGSTIGQAKAQEKIAGIRADQLKKQAVADKAEAVQTAKFERKKAEQLKSRVIALSAASGTDVSSLDVQNAISDIDGQGEYNSLAALYSGFSSASSKEYQASTEISAGRQAKSNAAASSAGTIMDFASTRYG